MIRDVILDVKNKKGYFSFSLLYFKIFLGLFFIYSTRLTKKKIKGLAKLERKRKYQTITKNGKRGIRTLGTNNSYNGLAIRRFSPLSHLSQLKKRIIILHYTWNKDWKNLYFSIFIYIIYLQLLLAIPFRLIEGFHRKKIEKRGLFCVDFVWKALFYSCGLAWSLPSRAFFVPTNPN
jgi:hypothetical protein